MLTRRLPFIMPLHSVPRNYKRRKLTLTNEQVEEIKGAFSIFDTNKTGTLRKTSQDLLQII